MIMKKTLPILVLFILFFSYSIKAFTQDINEVERLYEKVEHDIPMRDGINLHTVVYIPKDKSKQYPIIIKIEAFFIFGSSLSGGKLN